MGIDRCTKHALRTATTTLPQIDLSYGGAIEYCTRNSYVGHRYYVKMPLSISAFEHFYECSMFMDSISSLSLSKKKNLLQRVKFIRVFFFV